MKKLPPRPSTWNLTIEDMMAEIKAGKRQLIDQPELEWARDYERSLIPVDARFPKKGDVYEALDDMPVKFMTAWAAPCTGGGEGFLKKGERVFIDSDPIDSRPIGSYAVAVDYSALEERMVPASDRKNPQYGGFYFSFKTMDLVRNFKLVQTGYEKTG